MNIFQRCSFFVLPQLYLLLLQVEDLTSSLPEVKQSVTEDKVDLLRKIVSSLLVEDRLSSLMCVHKGKVKYLNITMNIIYLYGVKVSLQLQNARQIAPCLGKLSVCKISWSWSF